MGCDSNNQEGHVPEGDQQVVVFCTEKSAAVYSLPSQRQMYMQTINESSNVISGQYRVLTNKWSPSLTIISLFRLFYLQFLEFEKLF